MLDVHLDGPADVIGILLDQRLKLPDFQIGSVDFLITVFLDVHDHIGTDRILLADRNRIAVGTLAVPAHAFRFAEFARDHRYLIRYHKCGIKAHAELADDRKILFFRSFPVHLVLKLKGTAFCNNSEILFRFRHGHADPVVPNSNGSGCFVRNDINPKIIPVQTDAVIRQRKVAELVNGIRSV